MTSHELHQLFVYDTHTGNLFWRHKRGSVPAGHIVGAVAASGYRRMTLNYKPYAVHHIIWMMHFGQIPKGYQIDHIDHDRSNNRIENLRLVTPAQNSRNSSLNRRSTTGYPGVTKWWKRPNRWLVQISAEGQRCKYIGLYSSLEEAIAARKAAEVLYGYHPNHGQKNNFNVQHATL